MTGWKSSAKSMAWILSFPSTAMMRLPQNLLKSILFLVLSFLMAVSFAGCDCKGCNEEEGPDSTPIDLYFSSDEINLTIDDSRRLDVFVDGVMQNPADVKFGSENPNVVTINDAGEVTGYAPGSAYVTASMQGSTTKCMVNVDLLGLSPEIVFDNADYSKYSKIAIPLGDELDMAAKISFNGKIFDDAVFSYEIGDNTLGYISGPKFIANKTEGEFEITVKANWRGVNVEEKVIKIVLTNSLSVSVNGEPFTTINTTAVVLDKSGSLTTNIFDFKVVVTDRISEDPLPINVVLDEQYENIIKYDSLNNKITVNEKGTAFVDVYKKEADGSNGALLRSIKINISPYIFEEEKADEVYLFDAADGLFDVEDIFGTNTKIAGADFLDRELILSANDEGAVLGVTTDGKVVPTAEYVNVYNKQYGYKIQIKAYGKIVDTPEDLLWFNFSTDGKDFSSSKMNVKTLNGYYIMTKDIDMSGVDLSKLPKIEFINDQNESRTGNLASLGFKGTFDGQGYSINNMQGTVGGIFGILNGTVKNVAFNNVTLDKVLNASGAERVVSLLASRMFNSTLLENIYIDVPNVYSTNYSLLSAVVSSDIGAKNLVIILNTDKITSNCSPLSSRAVRSVNGYGFSHGSDNPYNRLQNVVIVTGIPLGTMVNNASRADGSGIYRMDAANVTNLNVTVPFTFLTSNVLNYTAIKNSTLYRFNNLDELSQNKDAISAILDKFSQNENWLVDSDGKVYWANDYIVQYGDKKVENNIMQFTASAGKEVALSVKNALGEVVSANVSYSVPANNGVVTLTGSTLSIVKIGTTTLTVKVGDEEIVITVKVTNPIIDRTNETPIILDADGEEVTVLGEEILSAELVGATATVVDNKVALIFDDESKAANKEYVVSFVTANYVYNYKVKYYTAYIKNADDFKSAFGYVADVTTSTIPNRNGYYVLANNIDFEGVEFKHGFINTKFESNTQTLGFTGTFDGNGYTMYNLTAPKGGVFGIVNGTVKNVAFINADVPATNPSGILATYTGSKAVFENIYLTYNGVYNTKKAMLTYYANVAGLTVKSSYFQGNTIWTGATTTSTGTTYTHLTLSSDSSVIVVSPYALSRRGTNLNATYDGAAKGSTTVKVQEATTFDGRYSQIYRYVSVSEMVDTYTKGETVVGGVTVDMSTQKTNLINKINALNKTYFSVGSTGTIGWKSDVSFELLADETAVAKEILLYNSGNNSEFGLSVKNSIGDVLDNSLITYSVPENNGIVTLTGATLKAVSVGKTTLTVEYEGNVLFTIDVVVSVNVIQKDLTIEVEQDANGENGVLSAEELASIFGTDSQVITEVKSLDADLTVEFDSTSNKLTFKNSLGEDFVATGKSYKAIIYNNTYGVELNVMPITKIIKTASDLAIFKTIDAANQADGSAITNSSLSNVNSFNGYYVLGADINASGINKGAVNQGTSTHTRLVYSNGTTLLEDSANGQLAMTKGLTGIFDGRGYTISNLVVVRGGLFGFVSGTIKNVAFTNIKEQYRYGTTAASYTSLLGIKAFSTAKIENVYIEHTGAGEDTTVFCSISRTATVTNLYYKTTFSRFGVVARNTTADSKYSQTDIYNGADAYKNFNNVVIISGNNLGGITATRNNTGGLSQVSGVHVVKDANSKFNASSYIMLSNEKIKHFADAADMTAMYQATYPYTNADVWNEKVTTSAKSVIDAFENDYFNVVVTKDGETITNVAIEWANINA